MLITHTLDATHHTPDNQTTNLTPHSSVCIQHPHVFQCNSTETTFYQQQWVLLPSEETSNTTGSMGASCRWPGTSSGVQFCPVLREVKTHSHVHNLLQLHVTDDYGGDIQLIIERLNSVHNMFIHCITMTLITNLQTLLYTLHLHTVTDSLYILNY